MTAVAQIQPSGMPAPISRALDIRLSDLVNALDPAGLGHAIAADRAPPKDIREALVDRRRYAERWLAPAGPQATAREVMGLFATLQSRGRTEAEKAVLVELMINDLADLPAWALAKACRAIRNREYRGLGYQPDGWVPDPGVVRGAAEGYLAELRKEIRQITQVLNARISRPRASPQMRARARQIAAEVAHELRMAVPRGERRPAEPEPPAAAETLAELAERMRAMPPATLSESALRSIGRRA